MREVKKITTEYVVESEREAEQVINEAKSTSEGVVTYKTAFKKETKKKPEYWVVTVTEDLSESLEMNQGFEE